MPMKLLYSEPLIFAKFYCSDKSLILSVFRLNFSELFGDFYQKKRYDKSAKFGVSQLKTVKLRLFIRLSDKFRMMSYVTMPSLPEYEVN